MLEKSFTGIRCALYLRGIDRVSSLGRAVVEEEPEEDPGDKRIAGEDKPALRETDPIDHKARRIGTDRGAEPIRHHQEDALSR